MSRKSNSNQSNDSRQQKAWISPAIAAMAYLQDFREIEGKNGNTYLVCDLNGIENTRDGNIYHRYGCFVHGEETRDLIYDLEKDLDEERPILMGVLLRGMKPSIFTYEKGKRKGQDDVSYQCNLMHIQWIRVGNKEIYRAESDERDENQHLTIPEYQEFRKNDERDGDRDQSHSRGRGRDHSDDDDEQAEDNSSRRARSSSRSSESSGSSRASSRSSNGSSSRRRGRTD